MPDGAAGVWVWPEKTQGARYYCHLVVDDRTVATRSIVVGFLVRTALPAVEIAKGGMSLTHFNGFGRNLIATGA